MSLINFLQKIQKKPRYVRIQILWLVVFVCMFFIISLWVVSLKYPLPDRTVKQSKTPLDEITKEIPSLKEIFKASIGAFFENDLEEEFKELEKELESQGENIEEVLKEPRKIKPAKLPLSD